LSDETEHQLDAVATDYLLVPLTSWMEELAAARRRFPQYANYLPVGVF
jgi:hypothetical protein